MNTGDAAFLTRTTLQIDGNVAGTSPALIRALQRVPGVLLAEVNAATARAVIAHDAAVSTTSLVAAAENAGVRVRLLAGMPPSVDAARAQKFGSRNGLRLMIAAAAFVALSAIDTLVANAAERQTLVILVSASVWILFIAESIIRRP